MNFQDVYEIQSLLYSYCWLIDAGDFDGVCELLKHANISYNGKLAIKKNPKAYMRTLKPIIKYEDGTPKTSHMCINPVVTVNEDGVTATAKSYTVVCQGITGTTEPKIIWIDRKLDKLEKVEGKWRFCARNFVTISEGDTSRHLAI